eukprot:Filipodium_phascolosomae@DN8669_c0_g1_i1.p1
MALAEEEQDVKRVMAAFKSWPQNNNNVPNMSVYPSNVHLISDRIPAKEQTQAAKQSLLQKDRQDKEAVKKMLQSSVSDDLDTSDIHAYLLVQFYDSIAIKSLLNSFKKTIETAQYGDISLKDALLIHAIQFETAKRAETAESARDRVRSRLAAFDKRRGQSLGDRVEEYKSFLVAEYKKKNCLAGCIPPKWATPLFTLFTIRSIVEIGGNRAIH